MDVRKPDKYELTLLYLLYTGGDFTKAVQAGGSYGLKAAYSCLLEGWIDRGEITAKGREVAEANREEIQRYLGKRLPDKKVKRPSTFDKVEVTVIKAKAVEKIAEPRIFYLPERTPERGQT